LVARHRIAAQIGGDDFRHEFGRLLIRHRFVPLPGQQQYTHAAQFKVSQYPRS
jgi:hypothetical protein